MDAKIELITSEMPLAELHKIIKNLSLPSITTGTNVLVNQETNTLAFGDIYYSYDLFYKDIYQLLKYESTSEARKLITKLKRRVSLLPNTVSDITSYLRKEQLSLLEQLGQCEKIDDVLYIDDFYTHSEINLINWVLKQVWQDTTWSDWTLKIRQRFEYLKLEQPDDYIFEYFWKEAEPALKKCAEPLTMLIAIRWIRRQIWICEHIGIDKLANRLPQKAQKTALTQRQLALYYVYVHITECLPRFDSHPGGKIVAYQEATKHHGLSWKSFQILYNQYLPSPSLRKDSSNIEVIEKVLPLLVGHTKAYKLALDELKIARSKTSYPLTLD